MPTYKHPCPSCDTFIERDVYACPACGRVDPFAPARCPSCRATVEPKWVACPKCGKPLGLAAATATGGATPIAPATPATPATPSAPSPERQATSAPVATACTACGAALPSGARFCRECGTVVA